MNGCEVRRGFFVLRDCGEPAFNTCMECGRSMCAAHTSMSEAMLCVECGARHHVNEENNGEEDAGWYDGQQTYAYRHNYYSRQH
ncbi:MAG TPA: hypothetical protein VLD57_12820, partial [Blastocatellia bacterium]|nr:hypothetical protein [Blastocatellia bacterium]